MPYGGRCRRNRKEQLSAPGFWLAVSCRRIRSSLRRGCTRALAAPNSAVRDFFHRAWACGALARCKSVSRVSSHRPLVGVVCRISRSGKRIGSVRRRQRLRRHALDLDMAVWVHNLASEGHYKVVATVRIRPVYRVRQHFADQPSVSRAIVHTELLQILHSSQLIQGLQNHILERCCRLIETAWRPAWTAPSISPNLELASICQFFILALCC